MMGLLNKNKKHKGLSDLVGIDFSSTAVKVVRLKKSRTGIGLAGLDLLPPVDFSQQSGRIDLPRNLCPHYGCLAYSSEDTVVRLINASPTAGSEVLPEEQIRELLNVGEEYRASAVLVNKGKGRQDSGFLAAAIPEDDARFLFNMFPSGPPAPLSIEVSGLASITAFLHARSEECGNESVCLIESGDQVSYFAFINRGVISLVGRYGFGGRMLRHKIVEELGVDDELAGTILSDQSINIAATILDVMNPFLKQLAISRDFMERHQKSKVTKVYASGGTSLLPHWKEIVQQELQIEAVSWNPFENIQIEQDVFPSNLVGQEARFAAAVGAAIGGLQES
ncbi:MAG: pilus assembly protein PilM [Kiritimatiellales bacterium]|nr:pilus assembly protein PilM [Kiritimatiellales bacterium]